MTPRLPAPALSSLADVTDERFTDEQRARVARFDAAPVPVEVAVEELRRVLADLTEAVSRGDEVGLPEAYRAACRALASPAPAPHAEEAS